MNREEAAKNPVDLAIWEFENAIKGTEENDSEYPNYFIHIDEYKTALKALLWMKGSQPDPETGLMPCGCGEWIYTIEKGSCMDYHVTAKCSECGWDWFSKDGVGNFSAVFSAFITNGDSKRDEAERFLIENAKANNKLNYCPNCGAKMENKP